MADLDLNKHISGQFNEELENLHSLVMKMGGLVEKQLEDALEAVLKGDPELAAKVKEGDRAVNDLEILIDESTSQTIAKRQPAASDLRLIIATSKAATDLERIGDVAKSVANATAEEYTISQRRLLSSMEALGKQVIAMLHEVLDAFTRLDVDSALEVHRKDKKVDAEFEAIFREMMTYMMEDPRSIPSIIKVMWSVRALERVGDRCQNIAEHIVYLVKGQDIRHMRTKDIDDLMR